MCWRLPLTSGILDAWFLRCLQGSQFGISILTTTEEHLRKIAHELTKIPPAVSKDTRYWQTLQMQKGWQTVLTMNSALLLVLKNGVSRKKRSLIPLLGQMMQKS
ncbi:hypothetical protein SADUNF_Sadunf19G0033600 [Salix dunnii]|uniref:Uncharacterized protein n=1 Tax=Salix dunnii TaxID=1413687 RepID=A0A835J159_9ROSI|nr:hypothetical protein SADUNF_Sadunf19G0033600 [Salix dunnii]